MPAEMSGPGRVRIWAQFSSPSTGQARHMYQTNSLSQKEQESCGTTPDPVPGSWQVPACPGRTCAPVEQVKTCHSMGRRSRGGPGIKWGEDASAANARQFPGQLPSEAKGSGLRGPECSGHRGAESRKRVTPSCPDCPGSLGAHQTTSTHSALWDTDLMQLWTLVDPVARAHGALLMSPLVPSRVALLLQSWRTTQVSRHTFARARGERQMLGNSHCPQCKCGLGGGQP